MAYRMGLHRDGTTQNNSVLETESRRHLWWQLVTLDTRTAEDHNTTPYILEPSFTTQFPCLIVDAGLPSPVPSNATASSTFFQLLHFELISFTRRIVFSETFNQANDYHTSSPIQKHKAINDFRQSLETRYFSHCGSINHLEFITAATVQLFLVKIKLAVYGVNEGREEAWGVVEQAYGYWREDETGRETGKWAVIEKLRARALTIRGYESEIDVPNGLELVPEDYGPGPAEELAEETGTGELPGDGTVCEWSMEAFEQYFQGLGAGDGMSNVL
ncbi:hypothetical protein AKAW_10019 [Aspergillus luchuensis IFO 4308]|nr:hypothetical protein AKAW_10019 [Aspergillus luchuensis IFO 4308]